MGQKGNRRICSQRSVRSEEQERSEIRGKNERVLSLSRRACGAEKVHGHSHDLTVVDLIVLFLFLLSVFLFVVLRTTACLLGEEVSDGHQQHGTHLHTPVEE